jgi:hypothetical protein
MLDVLWLGWGGGHHIISGAGGEHYARSWKEENSLVDGKSEILLVGGRELVCCGDEFGLGGPET